MDALEITIDEHLNPAQLATYLGIDVDTAMAGVWNCQIPAPVCCSPLVWSLASIEKWLADGCPVSGDPPWNWQPKVYVKGI
jgi:hypothetical protein